MKICTTYKCQNLWKNLWIKVLPFCFALHLYLALLKKGSFLNFHVRWKIKEQLWEKVMRSWKNYQWQFSDASKWKPVIHIQPKFIRLEFIASDTFSDSSKWTPIIPYPAQLQALQTWNLHNKLKYDFLISFIVLIYGGKLWQKVTIVWKMWCVSISIKFMHFACWINVGLWLHGFAAIW